jgi:RND family efflux transporter MFP subunit
MAGTRELRGKAAGWLGLVMIAGFVGCQTGGEGAAGRPAPQVTVALPLVESVVETSEFTGRFEATQAVDVRSRVGGYLESVHFVEGDNVAKGALLFIVDRRPFEAELAQAQAARQEAAAQLVGAEAQLEQAKSVLTTASSQMQLAQAEFTRSESLGNALSQSERDLTRSEWQKAQASVESAQAGIAVANADVARAEAAVATADAAIKSAELNLEYTEIRSPIDGRIGRRLVTEGNLISGGSEQATLLTTVVSLNPIYFLFDASEQQVLQFQRRTAPDKQRTAVEAKYPVAVRLADESQFTRPGYVDFVDNRFDSGTATKLVRAVFENTDGLLTAGMFGQLQMATTAPYEAVLLPDEAIGADQTDRFVYVVESNNSVRRQRVQTGPMVRGLRVVRQGLQPQDQVVVRGLQRIRPGVVVEPQLTTIQSQPEVAAANPAQSVEPRAAAQAGSEADTVDRDTVTPAGEGR